MKKTIRKYDTAKWAVVLAFTLITTAGCTSGLNPNSQSSMLPADNHKDTYLTGDTPQKTYLQGQEKENGVSEKEPYSNGANTNGGDTSAESSGKTTQASAKQQWNAAHPVMLGLAIGDSNAKVSERYGKADDVYSLEDDSEAIEVYEYKGFAVGINAQKTIQYIEVYDKSIVTGLSGIRVDDRTEAVLKALGKPSSQNNYIITYQGKDSLLKFDLDPDRDKIVSIKLLAGA
ncbi:hypothetical protein M3194_04125 [Paenibacillus glycanilyticus]|uniref:hypothetical protein n=1 Tax=Paenibacillus glycanilyticus TaxID=126569 RepID=UPI002041DBB1|nr:hypothetical protein [Paenibacillus glycanilyticus]MCM3626550.1 hypothetical protein [Paenibacillus glycanilyticus]